MRKIWIFISYCIFFLNSTSLHQLFKIPFLVTHYTEHNRLNSEVSVIDFLSMHYWGTDLNDNDQDKDMQLPFKKASASAFFQLYFPLSKPTVEEQPLPASGMPQPVFRQQSVPDPAFNSLFRPPRAWIV